MLQFFEELRRANADWYTASPLETLSDDDLARLAGQAGMTVGELREHLSTPHPEMTCPLCGQPQTHLVGCKGCGGNAWGWDFEAAHGEGAAEDLRHQLHELLHQREGIAQEQVHQAAKNAYAPGGCMVCSMCWHHTLPAQAYLICPLNLLSERVLNPEQLPPGLLMVIWQVPEEQRQQAVREWVEAVWMDWIETWNTLPAGPEREAVVAWRAGLLWAALGRGVNNAETSDT